MQNEQSPTQDQDALRIFLSHKGKDISIAQAIKDELERYGPNRLFIYLSEGIAFGEDWSEDIHNALRNADWLFLLYTDPTPEWDWCLYEVGFFAARKDRRLICLYRAGLDPPGPMKRWQSVRAKKEDWVKLLDEIFGKPFRKGVVPINTKLANNVQELANMADKIIKIVGPKPVTKYYNNFLTLHLEVAQAAIATEKGEVPKATKVLHSDQDSLRMFGLEEKPYGYWTWGELVQDLKAPDEIEWTKSLGIVTKNAIRYREIKSCLPLFHSKKVGHAYRPVIHRIDRLPDGAVRFIINFVEIPLQEDPTPPGQLGSIATLLSIARKFRWGVLKTYLDEIEKVRLDKNADAEKIEDCLTKLELALQSVESQAANKGLFDRTNIVRAFDERKVRDRVGDLFDEWLKLRQDLTTNMDKKKLKEVVEGLRQMDKMTLEFLVTASARYYNLLAEFGERHQD